MKRMPNQQLDLIKTVDFIETDHSTSFLDFLSTEHWLLTRTEDLELKTRWRIIITKSSTLTILQELLSRRLTPLSQSVFLTRVTEMHLILKLLMLDGGNYGTLRMVISSTRKVRSSMFQVEKIQIIEMSLYGTCITVKTNNGTLYTLICQNHQSVSFQISHSYWSTKCQVRDSWHCQDQTLLSIRKTIVQSNSLNMTQQLRQSKCSRTNYIHWLYLTQVSQETWLLTKLMELGTSTSLLMVNSSRMREA